VIDPGSCGDVECQVVAADLAANKSFERRLESVAPMTTEGWDSLAIDDLTEGEADAFWQAIGG
jgi:hypothetical protein